MIPNRKAPNVFADVREFLKLSAPELISPLMDGASKEATDKAIELGIKLIEEEVNQELIPALRAYQACSSVSLEHLAQILDGAIDSIYVIAWIVEALGLPGEAGWNEVQRSNMAKFPVNTNGMDIVEPIDDTIPYNLTFNNDGKVDRWILTNKETGKVMKPKGWTPPNLSEVLGQIINIKILRERTKSGQPIVSDHLATEYFHAMEARIERGDATG